MTKHAIHFFVSQGSAELVNILARIAKSMFIDEVDFTFGRHGEGIPINADSHPDSMTLIYTHPLDEQAAKANAELLNEFKIETKIFLAQRPSDLENLENEIKPTYFKNA